MNPPPPPPPHGSSSNKSGLPPGNYDIFVIPPHSSGSGFLYLPSLQTNRNSFLAGVGCTLVAVGIWTVVFPVLREWFATLVASGGMAVVVLLIGVGVAGWAWGKTQTEIGGPTGGGATGASANANGQPTSASPPPPPPPPPHPEPQPAPAPGPESQQRAPPPKPTWQRAQTGPTGAGGTAQASGTSYTAGANTGGAASAGAAKGSWEKAREETRKREDERKRAEELRKKREEAEQERVKQRERDAREREIRERREKREQELKEKAQAAPPPPRPTAPKPETSRPPSPTKRHQQPTAKTATEDDAYSFRPYDKPKRTAHTGTSASSIYSESSYAPSQSTSRTTPPPSHRGPYHSKDPDKIVLKAVYSFNNTFTKLPIAQLISGKGSVTDGLILRITTEGLFIDDDVRGVPQREWDIKAWTLKLVEVWCPQLHALGASSGSSSTPAAGRTGKSGFLFSNKEKGATKAPSTEESDQFVMDLMSACTNPSNPASSGASSSYRTASSETSSNAGASQTGESKGLHVLRANIRDQEGKRYVFVLEEEEGWKVAVGLQRLRRGTQVRALGVSGMAANEAKVILDSMGWGR
ncbi:MAG: hypothetical protein L6R38_004820 [Xanthoria sp. 2 TBL-2021]|nr:MAG: hypothetical protein L6R38_004820 [Xanthoria sp. 2 TBL-2021]